MATASESDFNRAVGANVALIRRAQGISQSDLASRLAGFGFPFQQPTVLKVEKGTRPLKFEEAVGLARCLEVPVSQLYGGSAKELRRAELAFEMSRVARDLSESERRLQELRDERQQLADRYMELQQEVRGLDDEETSERSEQGTTHA